MRLHLPPHSPKSPYKHLLNSTTRFDGFIGCYHPDLKCFNALATVAHLLVPVIPDPAGFQLDFKPGLLVSFEHFVADSEAL